MGLKRKRGKYYEIVELKNRNVLLYDSVRQKGGKLLCCGTEGKGGIRRMWNYKKGSYNFESVDLKGWKVL